MSKPLLHFILTALLGIALVAVALAAFYYFMAVRDLEQAGERHNETLGQTLSNFMWPSIAPLLQPPEDAGADELRALPAVSKLHAALLEQLSGLGVFKIKLYTLDGYTVFSTEPTQIGEAQPENRGIHSARTGSVISSIVRKKAFNPFDLEVEDYDLIQSYLPFRDSGGEISGVFEIYSDITPLLARIRETRQYIVLGVVGILGLFYLLLVAFFRRMDTALQTEQRLRARYLADVEEAKETLEQRVAERTKELKESSTYLQSIIDGVYDPVIVIDRDLQITTLNKAARDLARPDHDPAKPLYCYRHSHHRDTPCDGKDHPCTLAEILKTGKPVTLRHTHYTADKEARLVEVMGTPLHDADGEISGIVEINHDVTEYVRAMEAAQESEARAQAIMNNVNDSIILSDELGSIESLNPATCELFGYTTAELLGRNVKVLMPEPYRSRHDHAMKHNLQSGQQRILGIKGREFMGQRKDGSVFPVGIWINELYIGGKRKILAVIHDLTEQKRVERELEEAWQRYYHREKIASVGQLASGIIHEVGNPIAAITGAVHDIREHHVTGSCPLESCPLDEGAKCNLDLIADHTDRLTAITRQISEFASPRPGQWELLDLNGLIRSTWDLQRFDPRWKDLNVRLELDPDLPALEGIADQLIQIVMNLLNNSADACVNLEDREPIISIRTSRVEQRVHILVTDNGQGMDEATLEHATDTFFTTKPAGEGSGLGLSLCTSMLERLGGNMKITSSPGVGTSVDISLPVNQAADSPTN